MSGFLNAAIEQDYKVVPIRPKAQKSNPATQLKLDKKTREERERSAAIAEEKRVTKIAAEKGRAWLSTLPEDRQGELLVEFEISLKKSYILKEYKMKGLDSPLVWGSFISFLEGISDFSSVMQKE